MKPEIFKLREHPDRKADWARWFHEKWGVPEEAYLESMDACLAGTSAVPQWYAAELDGRVIGGLGVIENDFHNRPDLAPNVCAVYVEEAYRCQGLAGRLLDCVCEDMHSLGVRPLYLLTDYTGFYERYGWRYLEPVLGDGESEPARMYIHD